MAETTRPYVPHNWATGELITADKMNTIEQGIASIDTDIFSESGGIADQLAKLVKVSQQQPESGYNKIWVVPSTGATTQIPTYDELLDAIHLIAEEFITNKTYEKGQLVIHSDNGVERLYYFTTNHAQGNWNLAEVEETTVAEVFQRYQDIVVRVDDTLTLVGKPADAKKVGDEIANLNNIKLDKNNPNLTALEKSEARNTIGATTNSEVRNFAVAYDSAQILTEEQQSQARINIQAASQSSYNNLAGRVDTAEANIRTLNTSKANQTALDNLSTVVSNKLDSSDLNDLVASVTNDERTITVTTKGGTESSFTIPESVDFDGGVVAQNPQDNEWYLYFQQNGQDIQGYTPIKMPFSKIEGDGSLPFDGGVCQNNYNPEDPDSYYLILTKDDVQISTDIYTPIKLIGGGGGGGGGATSSITLSNVVRPYSTRDNIDCFFSFTATSSDDEDITVIWSVNNVEIHDNLVISPANSMGPSGSTFSINVKNYLKNSSSNIVKAQIISQSNASLTKTWTIVSSPFSINWASSVQPVMLYTRNESIFIAVNVAAEERTVNTVVISCGNHSTSKNITGSGEVSFDLPPSWFTNGENVLTAYLASSVNMADRTDSIHCIILWEYNATHPIVVFADQTLEGYQYDTIDIKYYVYDPLNEIAHATLTIGSEEHSVDVNRNVQTYKYVPTMEMAANVSTITVDCTISTAYQNDQNVTQTVTDNLTITVKKSPYNIAMITEALRYTLDPTGHSNNDSDRADFGNLTFSNNFDWINGGFQLDEEGCPAFVVKKGHRATLPRSVFADTDENGKTIDISFKVTNSDEYDAVAIVDVNNGNTKGIQLSSNEGQIYLNNAEGQVFKYCEGDRIDFSILVEKQAVDHRIVTVWLDGIPSKVNKYETNQSLVHNENSMVIGSDHCDVWIYMIRCYATDLTQRQMLQNYISNGPTRDNKIQRYIQNDVYFGQDEQTTWYTQPVITPETLHSAVPDLTIITIEAERMTKNKKDPVPAHITIQDGTTILDLPAATTISSDNKKANGCIITVQGTSSAAYERSALNLDINYDCKLLPAGEDKPEAYKISASSVPVRYLNVKVNVASSENANNICAVDWYNGHQPFLIEARQNNASIRDSVEGKPCAVFFTNTSDSNVWISSQLVEPNETILYAMGDLCNSKKNLAVFGEDGEGEHPTKCCIEVSGNDTQAQKFRSTNATYNYDDDEWQSQELIQGELKSSTAYEWRMEPSSADKAEVIQAWNDTVAWCVSTINHPENFYSQFKDYFNVTSMLYHFLMIEFFAAYDNVCKNTFYSFDWDENADQNKWGGYRWNINKAYDWDTIIACDNDGKLLGDYGLDYGDVYGNNSSYFNDGASCPIWVNIKTYFQTELQNLYTNRRSANTWDTNQIITKFNTYQNKRPRACMIHDAYVKYVFPYKTRRSVEDGPDESYLPRMVGSKIYQRHQFFTYQLNYMDGKYGYFNKNDALTIRSNAANGTTKFSIKAYAKTYMAVMVDNNLYDIKKVNTKEVVTFEGVSIGNNTTLYFIPNVLIQYLREQEANGTVRGLDRVQPALFNATKGAKLTEVWVGGDVTNMEWKSGETVSAPSVILKDFNLRNVVNYNSSIDTSVNTELVTFDTRGTRAARIIFAPYAPLTSIQLNACTGVSMSNLTKVQTFTMASGSNLTYINVNDCNALVNSQIKTYLTDSLAGAENITRYVRLTGIDWNLSDTTLLQKLLNAKGIDTNGNEVNDGTSVLSGHVHVPKIYSIEEEQYNAAWPALNITYDQRVVQYSVPYYDYDRSRPIKDKNGNNYVQYVDAGQPVIDPITSGDIDTPENWQDEKYAYTFDHWGSLTYDSNNIPRISDSVPATIYNNSVTIIPRYSKQIRTFTVTWYLGHPVSGQDRILEQLTEVQYGACVEPENNLPTYTEQENTNKYYVFTGWDKSTGYITGDTNVTALWQEGELPYIYDNKTLNEMTWAERYAVARNDACERVTNLDNTISGYWELGENLDFELGRDFDFSKPEGAADAPGYVKGINLVNEPTYFDGSTTLPIICRDENNESIHLFDGSIPRWTLAIDYEFTSDQDSLIGCFAGGETAYGFKLEKSGTQVNVWWGGSRVQVGYQYTRSMVVLRYDSTVDPNRLFVTYDYHNSINYPILAANHLTNVTNATLDRNTSTINIDNPLILGGSSTISMATGWIHWAKLWYDNLGIYNARRLSSFIHFPVRCKYTGIKYDAADGLSNKVGGGFLFHTMLPYTAAINYSTSDTGGWPEAARRQWLNNQFFDCLPVPLQSIIRTAHVATIKGSSAGDDRYMLEYSEDKIYLPSIMEGNVTTSQATPYPELRRELDSQERMIPYYISNPSQGIDYMGYTRLMFAGFTVPDDVNYVTTDSDPNGIEVDPANPYTIIPYKTIWCHRGESSRPGFLFIDKEYIEHHKVIRSILYLPESYTGTAVRPSEKDGEIVGYWVQGTYWWARSPYHLPSGNSHPWWVISGGYSTNNYTWTSSTNSYGIVPAFSI